MKKLVEKNQLSLRKELDENRISNQQKRSDAMNKQTINLRTEHSTETQSKLDIQNILALLKVTKQGSQSIAGKQYQSGHAK